MLYNPKNFLIMTWLFNCMKGGVNYGSTCDKKFKRIG